MPEPIPIPSAVTPLRRALISVHDKTGIAEVGRALAERGVQIVSTGGTAAALKEAGVQVSLVEEKTGFPEILGGRVKTLHPKIFGGVLADESREDHAGDLARASIETFDLVVVNLYPFQKTAVVVDPSDYERVLEEIRMTGGTRLSTRERLAAKAFSRTAAYDAAIALYFA